MNHVKRYFQEGTDFVKVTALCDQPSMEWEAVAELVPAMPRGWWELAQLTIADRIEFLREYWTMTLPFSPNVSKRVDHFFAHLESVEFFITQKTNGSPYVAEMVYSVKGDRSFFHGQPPASPEQIIAAGKWSESLQLPADYLAFLRIHDGFSKVTDTGLIPVARLKEESAHLQALLAQSAPLVLPNGEEVNPAKLIPFYRSFGLDCYQCFFGDWYPEQEMGNLYYSGIDRSLSDFSHQSTWVEQQAFPTFLDWLVFYLELIE
jgi:hypothetical protein